MATNPFGRPRPFGRLGRLSPSIARPRSAAWCRVPLCMFLAVSLVPLVLGCAPSRPISPLQRQPSEAPAREGFDANQQERLARLRAALDAPVRPDLAAGLLVRLAFDEAADLDLFVTDPRQESVYFANSPTRSGGRLVADRRCADPPPRIEAIHFPAALPGRYRVGVDFHGRCQATSLSREEEEQGIYVVRIRVGERVLESAGMVTPGRFEVIVTEFDLGEGEVK